MAVIFCYTSTGNSLDAAKIISEKIDARILPMKGNPGEINDSVIGFIFPVYFWRLPRSAERFVRQLRLTHKNPYIFAIATYGGMAFNVPGRIKRILSRKGLTLNYGKSIKSIENYTPLYQVKNTKEQQQSIAQNISVIAQDIYSRANNRPHSDTILNAVIHKFYPNQHSDQFFTVSGACTGCMVCSKVCPAENIKNHSGSPDFMHQCDHCLASLHNCPVHAIEWKEKTRGKNQYRNANVSLNELIKLNTGKS